MGCWQDTSTRSKWIIGFSVVGILLVVILVPLTFSYVEYYEYGLDQTKTSGSVDTEVVYVRGRHNLGPAHTFLTYQADAHVEQFDELEVFSASVSNSSIGLAFKIDVDFTYLLNRDEIGLLHQKLATSYRDIISSRTREAIKNEAIFVTFTEYFQARKQVEARFREAVQKNWNTYPPLYCTLDQFHLGRIQIPESVAEKQVESKIQNERNDKEAFLQEAQIEREMTSVQVNSIYLEEDKVLRTARAEASLLRENAQAQARQILADAQVDGTLALVRDANITTQEEITAFAYIRTLTNRDDVQLDIDYLTSDNIVKTRQV